MAFAAVGRILPLALLVSLVVADFDEELSRSKRFAASSCQMTPSNTADMVVDKNQPVKLTCNFDSTVQSCIWSHYNPLNDGMGGTAEPDIMCTGSSGDTGRPCVSDSRISFQSTTTQCGISLSNTKPEDTGRWKLVGVGLTTTGSPQTAEKNLELWTYNQSYTRLTDNRDTEIKTLDTSYNYNIKKEEWESGKSDWENLEFKCTAYGGRPTPKFLWYIDSNNNDPLAGSDGFTVTEGQIGSSDRYGYVKHMESRITFRVDDKLLRRLEKYNINTNPSNGVISFELRCDVQQNLVSAPERPTVRLNVKKSYDDGNLTAGTIGIIVGVVVAVILAVIAIALLVFAKSSGRWCFADDEEAYRKPQEARPRTAGGPPAQSAQRQRRQ